MPVYNCHVHIFSAACAPQRLIEAGIGQSVITQAISGTLKSLVETSIGRTTANVLSKILPSSGRLSVIKRYATFAYIGTNNYQRQVFKHLLDKCNYTADTRFVVLTLNMDHMGAGRSELVYEGQLYEVARLRCDYPHQLLPFLSIDPREGIVKLKKLIDKYIGFVDNDVKPFIGLKIYPALGYFPFDSRLSDSYDLAAQLRLPIMTHCTRGGSYYLGRANSAMLNPPVIPNVPSTVLQSGGSYYINTTKKNAEWTEVFGQPDAWRFVFDSKPEWKNLKVCFAHMGGTDEIFQKHKTQVGANWLIQILMLMEEYPNIYTDVSFSLSYPTPRRGENAYFQLVLAMLTSPSAVNDWLRTNGFKDFQLSGPYATTISERILFGTDYFMTEQEQPEKLLSQNLSNYLLKFTDGHIFWYRLSELNPLRYLRSDVYQSYTSV